MGISAFSHSQIVDKNRQSSKMLEYCQSLETFATLAHLPSCYELVGFLLQNCNATTVCLHQISTVSIKHVYYLKRSYNF